MNTSIVQSMINAIDKPAIFIDTQYTILAVNDAYRDTYETEVVVGTSRCFEISHGHKQPCDKHDEECPIQTCKATNRSCSVVHIHNTELGKTYCDILMKPVKDENGITTGFLEILDRINFASAESEMNKMIGASVPFKQMLTQINRAAKSEISVLLHGETGTGKELVAKALHESSPRAEKPFVVIECTGLNENLFESELFGHEKGSFTGATHAKKGLIEIANGGTVFFDEIADVPLSMQVKLLRLLETQCYRSVGGIKQKKADFRLICASHKNLLELVEQGEFRKDLYYRIAGFPIELPSLSERKDDIPSLAKHFLNLSESNHKRFTDNALSTLSNYRFPGNIRELRNIVEHSALMANEDIINVDDLPRIVTQQEHQADTITDTVITLEDAEATYLKQLCETQTSPINELADVLGVSTRTLYRKLQKYGLKYE
ncbi:sigma-54 interaction domain-containing protein [Alteromonas facilis]|uniref:sigma-54 interaction domain-containing protein n=1 Tax=Alteromonas facilis TaxID=2048004 RepID=UPI001F0BE51B|nr:sigma-54-dependent Fis family transcriptional regulator [Alteromonas facilis]